MIQLRYGFFVICLSFLMGCATGDVTLGEQNYSLGEIKQVIQSVIGDPRKLSQNQRTYLSQYFGPKNDKNFDPIKSKRRLYAKIVVLGDRRPYDIDIDVVVEEKNGNVYEEIGLDTRKAEEFSLEIENRLSKGIENRNVIDDFRVF